MGMIPTLLTTILLTFTVSSVMAATPSGTQTPTMTPANKQIEDLKNRLATKAAELKQLERRGMDGTVKSKTITTLTMETAVKDVKIELTDDIKIFEMIKGKRTTLSIDDVTPDDRITVFGEYDTTIDILKAKVIVIQNGTVPTQIEGTIGEVNKPDYSFTVLTGDQKTYTIDFETTTKTNLWSSDGTLVKGGFSKIVAGNIVVITGTPVPKKTDRISAARILNLGDLTGAIASDTKASSASASAKATPTPTKAP